MLKERIFTMKKYYSIGEVSRIMGISTQALRYYCSIDLLEPAYINPETGNKYMDEIAIRLNKIIE